MDRHNRKTISKLKSLLKDSKNITKKLKRQFRITL
jgi:hypothetical protein